MDMPDVVDAKRRSLAEVNAQTTRTPQSSQTEGYAYDIHTANYCTFAADLETRSATHIVLEMYSLLLLRPLL